MSLEISTVLVVTNLFYQVDLNLISLYEILVRQVSFFIFSSFWIYMFFQEHLGDERFREETFWAMLQENPNLAMNERQRRKMDETLCDIKIKTEYALVPDR